MDPRDTNEGKARRRQSNFWRQWGERSQQDFWQEVGFNHDRANEERRSGVTKAKGKTKAAAAAERETAKRELADDKDDLLEEEYWNATDALDASGLPHLDWLLPHDKVAEHYWGTSGVGSRAGVARAGRAREALMRDGEVASSRRAELLTLLEDLGPEGLLPPPKPVKEKWLEEKESGTFKLTEDLSRSLLTTRNYSDGEQCGSFLFSAFSLSLTQRVCACACAAVTLRQNGLLPEGAYFSYLLNTRRVVKVTAEGKRQSFSCLVCVGNGMGTAGVGMGKDINAGNALYKATVDARKNLHYIDRFDGRTLWHAIDDRYAKTKVVMRMRRPGAGTRCSWGVWKLLSAFGITDCSVKIYGSKNPTTVSYAVVNALRRMMGAQEVADRRGLRVLDMDPALIRYPGYDGRSDPKP